MALLSSLSRDITHPSVHNPDIPHGLERQLLKALHLKPTKRVSSASEFAGALLEHREWFEAD